MTPNSRLTRLERLADGFGEAIVDPLPPEETYRIVIYDPGTGPPDPAPGDRRPRFLVPDNGRGKTGTGA
jgi:hypothetical protein